MSARRDERGFTVVEVLVTMSITVVVGALVVTSLIQGSRSTVAAQDRSEGIAELQLALERLSRELRAADPLTAAEADSVELEITRDGQVRRIAYAVTGRELVESRTVGAATTSTVLAQEVDVLALTYYDDDGDVIAAPVPTAGLDDVHRAVIRIERFIPGSGEPIEVQTTVYLRNST
ncbi:MAG TPA: type II secretion system protein [Egibacteraceae bacterium]|nr:type II secretion system protein [Egibacteraceae bacterium]